MRQLYAAPVACLIFLTAQSATALPAPILVTFEGLTPSLSPAPATTGSVVSAQGRMLDEAGVAGLTALKGDEALRSHSMP